MQKERLLTSTSYKTGLENSVSWWMEHTIDQEQGGFMEK